MIAPTPTPAVDLPSTRPPRAQPGPERVGEPEYVVGHVDPAYLGRHIGFQMRGMPLLAVQQQPADSSARGLTGRSASKVDAEDCRLGRSTDGAG
jgi:hypothetical protein